MAEIINLRTRRKQAARDAARTKGGQESAKHGQSRAVKTLEVARKQKAERDLDAHRRETPEQPQDD